MTSNLPEPGEQPLRASDAEREAVARRLSQAYGEGRLTLDEFAERTSAAQAARTHDELATLVHDLPAGPAAASAAASAPTSAPGPAPGPATGPASAYPPGGTASAASTPPSDGQVQPATAAPVVAVFGSAQRTGRWRPARLERAVAVFGGVDLDLRDVDPADLPAEVQAYAVFGGVDITVPSGVAVEMTGLALFGGRGSEADPAPPLPGRPVLRVHAVALFGGVNAKARPPRSSRP